MLRHVITATALAVSLSATAGCAIPGLGEGEDQAAVATAGDQAAVATVAEDAALGDANRQMDEIIRTAYDAMAEDVSGTWGSGNMAMPSRTTAVLYEDGMASRTVMDFETGMLRVDRLVEPGEDEAQAIEEMRAAVDRAMEATPADLAASDTLMAYAKDMADAEDMAMLEADAAAPPDATEMSVPALEGIVAEDAADRVGAGTVTETTVTGDDGQERMMLSYTVPFIPGFYGELAARYADTVMRYAREHGVPPSLILAVMQTESAFNPRATSHIPAYGLMQIVPRSAGIDAYMYVAGGRRLLTAEELYQVDKNIHLGTIYLKILDTRYLRAIEDPESRLHSVIAAYNTGAGNVARAFNGTTNIRSAAAVINGMTPDEVFDHLEANLPFEETRRYIVKVTEARDKYVAWDQ